MFVLYVKKSQCDIGILRISFQFFVKFIYALNLIDVSLFFSSKIAHMHHSTAAKVKII